MRRNWDLVVDGFGLALICVGAGLWSLSLGLVLGGIALIVLSWHVRSSDRS